MIKDDKFRFGWNGDIIEHNKGDVKCPECWKVEQGVYPRKCSKCGGLKHGQFGDEMEDGYYLEIKCESCGDEFDDL